MYDDFDARKTFSKIKINHFQKRNYYLIKSLYWTVFNPYKYEEKKLNAQIVSGFRIRNSLTHIRSITIEKKSSFRWYKFSSVVFAWPFHHQMSLDEKRLYPNMIFFFVTITNKRRSQSLFNRRDTYLCT